MELKDLTFYKGKRVLVTGHTGFKGTWLCAILLKAGAEVAGYSLAPNTTPSLYELSGIDTKIQSYIGDIADYASLKKAFDDFRPQIVLHLAAQPLVRESYLHPVETYRTNVMGTVNVLECVRQSTTVISFLNVTTDKVYLNKEWCWGYRETEELDGFDPYSNSKSCSELVTHSYKNSFFTNRDGSFTTPISTARAGNVIGGGDFATDRIIPDCVRAAMSGEPIIVRNPHSTRPYQHVLEPLFAYLLIVREQANNNEVSGWYNVGPDESDCYRTGDIVDIFVKNWRDNLRWECQSDNGPHEANFLKLDCSKIKSVLAWRPTWDVQQAVAKVVEWTKAWNAGCDVHQLMNKQIDEFCNTNG